MTVDKQCHGCKLWMDDLQGHKCDPEATKRLEDASNELAGGWNFRVCVFMKGGHQKIGIFEVYYDKNREPIMRSKEPKLSWFIDKCDGDPSVEQAGKEAQWELKCMLKAFRNPMLDAVKDF